MDADTEAYLQAVEAWLVALNKDLESRLSVFNMPPVPRVKDYTK